MVVSARVSLGPPASTRLATAAPSTVDLLIIATSWSCGQEGRMRTQLSRFVYRNDRLFLRHLLLGQAGQERPALDGIGQSRAVEDARGQLVSTRKDAPDGAVLLARAVLAPAIRHLAQARERGERAVDDPHHLSERDL